MLNIRFYSRFVFSHLRKNVLQIIQMLFGITFIYILIQIPSDLKRFFLQKYYIFFLNDRIYIDSNLIILELILAFIFIPIIGFSMFFSKLMIQSKMSDSTGEILLLKKIGVNQNQLFQIYMIEMLICGVISCLFSGIMGDFLLNLLKQQLERELFFSQKDFMIKFDILASITFKKITLQCVIGLFYSYIISIGAIKKVVNTNIEKLEKKDVLFIFQSKIPQFIRNHKLSLLLVSSFPFVVMLLLDLLNINFSIALFDFVYFFLFVLAVITTPIFIIFFPIFGNTQIFRLLCNLIKNKINKVSINVQSRLWPLFYSMKKIVRKESKNTQKLFLITISLCIIIFAINFNVSENYYYDQKNLHVNGNGNYLRIEFQEPQTQENITGIISLIESNKENLTFDTITRYDSINVIFTNLSYNNNYIELDVVDSGVVVDYRFFDSLPKEWFTNISFSEIKLQSRNSNFVLCPDIYLDYGFQKGDSINFTFRAIDNEMTNIILKIGGFYSLFPLIDIITLPSNSSFCSEFIFHNFDLFSQIQVNAVELIISGVILEPTVFYSNLTTLIDQNTVLPIKDIIYEKQNIISPWNYEIGFNLLAFELACSKMAFYLLISFVCAVFINMIIHFQFTEADLLKESKLLRIQGASNGQIFQIQIIEFILYFLIGSIMSLISIVSLSITIALLNIINSPVDVKLKRVLRIDSITTINVIAIFFFFCSLAFSLKYGRVIVKINQKLDTCI